MIKKAKWLSFFIDLVFKRGIYYYIRGLISSLTMLFTSFIGFYIIIENTKEAREKHKKTIS